MFRFGDLNWFLSEHSAIAQVRLTRVRGSSPRDVGAWMLVSATATLGTIGGGQLEYMAIDEARAMLSRGVDTALMDVPLGPEIGQCCGGRVELSIARMTDDDRSQALDDMRASDAAQPHVYILGAGHVGRALAECFERLPVNTILIDSRREELSQSSALAEQRLSVLPEADVRNAPSASAFIVLTHDHALDFLLTAEALSKGDAAYVGMIGSATKRASFNSWVRTQSAAVDTGALICPMGATGSVDKRPEVIASFITAEVMTALTALTAMSVDRRAHQRTFAVG